ncbi:MupA/Atu3671 family FMN-dependent luciferase-like monooxygenase [Alteromonas sp. ASW11-130]|uniref:MupA/Atu3671 family FMN-dependent luciferase-like monooxygenase n=1 Tax=Alteromonas sp. ASW11-130 TaxID=3015775 RepID=UPI00224220F7|nr:MupA/Atu3671 family FMN-dependent luciferase-like monooxygenase [Alteromonas sp. ASW11-130]MCW8091974.1 LLM class flavin-dependent oxidoreductase [Alteromonas sp. ASW11-130]
MNTLESLLRHLSANDVKLNVENNKIKYKDPKNIVQGEVLEKLKEHKLSIIDLLQQTQSDGNVSLVGKYQVGKPIPVSQYQRSLLFSEQLTKEGEGNNLALSFRFKYQIDGERLTHALANLFEHNDALRLGYLHQDNDWQARLNPMEVMSCEVQQSTEDKLVEDFGNVENYCVHYIKEKFKFDGSPLTRAQILQLDEEDMLLNIAIHHSVCDGISLSHLAQQLESYFGEEKIDGGAQKASYLDYLVWQEEQTHNDGLSYWKDKLSGIPDTIDLPFDNTRPSQMTFAGATYQVALLESQNKKLAQLSQALGASQFNLILSAFNSFLSRYTAQKDIVVGVPFANRELSDVEQMIGLFINTLPIRTQLTEQQTFKQLISQVSETLQEASINQQTPLVEIIEAVNPVRSASYSPLFQVLVNYLDAPVGQTVSEFQQSVFNLGDQNEQLAKYDLSLNIVNRGGTHELIFEYNNLLFTPQTVIRMAEHFVSMLESMLDSPDLLLSEHSVLTEDEKTLIESINATQEPLPPLINPSQYIEELAANVPDKTAIIFQDDELSFGQFNKKVDSIASYLVDAGVNKGDRVGLYFIRTIDMVCAMYACFRLGAAYVPLDPSYPQQRIRYICDDTKPNCVLSLSILESKVSELGIECPILFVDTQKDALQATLPSVTLEGDDTAYIIHTSGTTGNPKGVEVSHRNLQNLLISLDETFDENAEQTWLAQTSISFDISIIELIWTLSRGKKVVLQQSKPADLVKFENNKTTKPLDFSIMFFSADSREEDKYDLMLRSSTLADQNGFKSVWLPERHFGEFGGAFASPSITCAALSTITKHIQLRAGSVVLPLHDPIRVAEEWSMIDNLSDGRVGLALASGWHPNDFVFQGADYENRHQMLREKHAQLQDLWQGKTIIRKNGIGQEHEVAIRPTPKQKELPTWITAAGNPETFRYAGQVGANILTHMLGQTMNQLKDNIAIYHAELEKHGHAIGDKEITLMLHTYLDVTTDMALSTTAEPFKGYIGSSVNLIAPFAQEMGMDMEVQKAQIIDIAFERLSQTSALFGTVESCQDLLSQIHNLGVTEIASLIDFGVKSDKVLSSLEKLTVARKKHQTTWELENSLSSSNYMSELELIEKHDISHVQMTPSQMKILLKQYEQNACELKVTDWLLGGEALPKTLVEQLTSISGGRCHNMYGPTETTVWSAWHEVTDGRVVIGKPIYNTEFLLLDENKKPVPIGVSGQLHIGGSGVSKGYWNKPELTAKSFAQVDLGALGAGTYYSTGDSMRMTADGYFEYIGRIDDQIKINGYRIEQKEIEKNITELNGIKDCKIVVKSRSEDDVYLAAYVVKSDLVVGGYTQLPAEEEAKPYSFTDGSLIFHQSDHQLGGLYKEIFEDEIYFKHGIEIGPGDVVMDVGANVGAFTMAAQQRQPLAQFFAFEPIPQTFSALKKNFEHRNINGRLFNCGISNKPETATFTYYQNMSGLSGRFANIESEKAAARAVIGDGTDLLQGDSRNDVEKYLQEVYQSQDVECRLDTISNVIKTQSIKQIDLLKIDIEKSECLALQGIEDEYWPRIKQVAMEVDGDEHLAFVTDTLEGHGFEVFVDDFIRANTDEEGEFNVYMLYAHNRRFRPGESEQATSIENYTDTDIKQKLLEKLPEFMVPSEIFFLEKIPMLQNGKLDVSSLKRMANEQMKLKSNKVAVSEHEKKVAHIWNLVLKRENSPVDISFFELGGTSFDIVNLQREMKLEFDIELSIIDLFRHKTIMEQAALIKTGLKTKATKPVKQEKAVTRRKSMPKRRKTKNNMTVE